MAATLTAQQQGQSNQWAPTNEAANLLPVRDVSTPLTANYGKQPDNSDTSQGPNLVVAHGVSLRGREGGATAELRVDQSPALRASQGGGDKPHVLALAENQRHEVRTADVAPSVSTGGGKPGRGYPAVLSFTERGRDQGGTLEWQEDVAYSLTAPDGGARTHERQMVGGFGVRRLTPTECERLMGWDDGHTELDDRGNRLSDSVRYRLIGNGVVANVTEWIGRRLIAACSDAAG